MNIIITSAGRRVSLVRAFQLELKKIVPNGKVFAADANPELAAACYTADASLKLPMLNDQSYIDTLINLCRENHIKLIIPTIDTELMLLAGQEERFLRVGIKIMLSSLEFIKKCRDKRVTHTFFKENGIATAKEYSKDNYTLPLFLKPFDGSRSLDTFIIQTRGDFTNYHFTNEKLMFLEYLDHSLYEEFSCDLYYGKDDKLKCAVPRKRIDIRDGEVSKAITVRNELLPYLKAHLGTIKGARGCLTAQFFKHKSENKIYGIEVNPRFGGGFPLAYMAGANYPKWIIEEYLLDKNVIEDFECWEANLLMIRYDNEILVHEY